MSHLSANDQRVTLSRLKAMVKAVALDPRMGPKARWLLIALIVCMLLINGLNVVNSFIGRDFMTAIADHDEKEFWDQALLYLGVFGALTFVSVMSRFTEESLGLLWRKWMTWRLFELYADHRVYWRMDVSEEVDNPDQRIAEDVKAFTTTSVSFVLMLSNALLTVIAFSSVLWHISPQLFLVAIGYALVGTLLTIQFGKPLIKLNDQQLDKEAAFRSSLIGLREHADMIALSRREAFWIDRAFKRLQALTDNLTAIIRTNRNVGFFTTGFNWMIQIIPALIVAPLFIEGKVEFGVITQSAVAFTQLMGAFSLIITQFQSISSFVAVINRLSLLSESALKEKQHGIQSLDEAKLLSESAILIKDLTLNAQHSPHCLVHQLTATFKPRKPVLVYGSDAAALTALFRSIAGIWSATEGRIQRPPLDQCLFVSERPYLTPCTLSELFLRPYPDVGKDLDDPSAPKPQDLLPHESTIQAALSMVGLETLAERHGGFHSVHDWDSELPLAEQQLLVIARVTLLGPAFVLLDRPGSSLEPSRLAKVLEILKELEITAITFEHTISHIDLHENALEILEGGQWQWHPSLQEPLAEMTARSN
ncbi:MAG: ABC transporter ATP-binding protein/permease [Gammaproteobacteria bacterium]|nr:ABC transporter ATP-binding protein/permease [Gammaproteobacteria bacterium]NBT44742.1 ABC transporter ATP-binding protein/permease [Gammaproteobacteria bacterium]NBY22116.1 ABC transporter ATP-binding protein/permease [Gammaproteobacteria bacterium]